jgi:two-component system, OmpR family, alkaline phosphatase synthesis response regulator PhoP
MNENILIVEDEEALRMALGDRLRSEGYVIDFAVDGEQGMEKATQLPFDLIILDIMLPLRSGLEVCTDIRRAGLATPVIILTARSQTSDKVVGFHLGADDYVTKPFDTLELMARIKALLRRAPIRTSTVSRGGSGVHQFGTITVDVPGTVVTRDGENVYLTAREFELLRYFVEHPGITLSRQDLLREVWGHDANTLTRTVDVHVASLRRKLESVPQRPRMILTISGLGYKFNG